MNNFSSFLSKNKSGLLMGFGLSSMILATFFGIRYAPDAAEALREKREELGVDKLHPIDIVKTAGVYFVPTAVCTLGGTALILGANHMNLEKGAAAVAAYTLSENMLQTYREKTREIIGEKKEKDIQEAVAKEALENSKPQNSTLILTGYGDCLCYDQVANQEFRSSINKIEKIINNLNMEMRDHIVTLDDYCLAMGLNTVILGNDIGWDINTSGYIDVYFTAAIAANGEPEIVISHNVLPRAIR